MAAEILGDFRACYKPPENCTRTGENGRILGKITQKIHKNFAPKPYSIGKSTISYWLKIAREQAVCGTLPNKGNPKLMTSLKLPKGVTYLQAHTAVNAKAFMSETAFGQFCRKHGYLASVMEREELTQLVR